MIFRINDDQIKAKKDSTNAFIYTSTPQRVVLLGFDKPNSENKQI